jgi:8-oxo-dGTP diphosphatase
MPSTGADDYVHVAVGILVDRGRIFVTRRRADVHQAGKWEFPGGKLDADESPFTGLQRELHEELGIDVQTAHPLMQVRHAYSDKNVLLDVWRVDRYSGVPHGREGQEARWASRDELLTLDLPEADLPIQRRLWLPPLYAVSDGMAQGRDVFLRKLERALAGGLALLQLREPEMSEDDYLSFAREVVSLCRPCGAKVLLNADPTWVEVCGADGVHLNGIRLRQLTGRPLPQNYFVAASCHNRAELDRAGGIGADLAVLGPVARTATHPQAEPLGWEQFELLCRPAIPAIYALGGMTVADIERARSAGAQGVAMIGSLWRAPEETAAAARETPL